MSLETRSFEFGDFRFDAREMTLFRDGKPIPITPKAAKLLLTLLENAGHVCEKSEIMTALWPDSFVEESNLTFTVSMLRKALEDSRNETRYIETVPKRGYRFVSTVSTVQNLTPQIHKVDADTPLRGPFSKLGRFAVLTSVACIGLFAIFLVAKNSGNTKVGLFASPFSVEKMSSSGTAYSSAISPDGKMVAYTNGVGNRHSLWLRHLNADGRNVEIVPLAEADYRKVVFSPDSNFVYFARFSEAEDKMPKIYRISVFGGIPETIVSSSLGNFALSPDGGRLAYVRCENPTRPPCGVFVADALTGANEKKVAERNAPYRISDTSFSVDGKRLFYAFGQSENASSEFEFAEVEIETGVDRPIGPDKFFNIRNLSSLPDGSGLIATASRVPNKNFQIWKIPFGSAAVPLTNDAESYGVVSIDAAAEVLAATQVKHAFNVRIHDFDGTTLSPGTDLAPASVAAFAADGSIVFSSAASGNDEIWRMQPDGSQQRQLTHTNADEDKPVVSPDGRSVYYLSNQSGEMQIWRVNLDGTNQTQITTADGGVPMFVSPDGDWVYYLHSLNRQLWRVPSSGGRGELFFDKVRMRYAISPNGGKIAFAETIGEEKYFLIRDAKAPSTSAGEQKMKFPDPSMRLLDIAWLPDGSAFVYAVSDGTHSSFSVWLQPIDNRAAARRLLDLGSSEITSLALSGDGRRMAVVHGNWKHDAVLLRGVR